MRRGDVFARVGIIGTGTIRLQIIALRREQTHLCRFKSLLDLLRLLAFQVGSEVSLSELAQKVGMALQDPETQILCPDVETEVAFGPENLGIPREEIIERTSYVLKAVRLEGMLDRSPNEMSGGQKQRLALAAVLAMRPDVLVLDEPTSQMDPIGSTEVLSVVRDLNKKYGVTIVMAEHKSEEVAEIADRIILLNDGEMIASGDPHEVFSKIDLLDKIEVKVPPVTRLGFELRKKGFKIDKLPITLQEAVADIPKPHKRRAHSTQPAAGATAGCRGSSAEIRSSSRRRGPM